MNTILVILVTMLVTAYGIIKLQQYVEKSLDKAFANVKITKKQDNDNDFDLDFERYFKVMAPQNQKEYNEVVRRFKDKKVS